MFRWERCASSVIVVEHRVGRGPRQARLPQHGLHGLCALHPRRSICFCVTCLSRQMLPICQQIYEHILCALPSLCTAVFRWERCASSLIVVEHRVGLRPRQACSPRDGLRGHCALHPRGIICLCQQGLSVFYRNGNEFVRKYSALDNVCVCRNVENNSSMKHVYGLWYFGVATRPRAHAATHATH